MSKKIKKKCCERFKKGKKACDGCPVMAQLAKGKRTLKKNIFKKKKKG